MEIKDISSRLRESINQIDTFISSLHEEKKYFKSISKEMVLRSKLVLCLEDNNKIVGVSGLEKKYYFYKIYIIMNNNYHRLGLGKKLLSALISEAGENYNMIVAVINPDNSNAISLFSQFGFRKLGRRDRHDYLLLPLNSKKGFFWYHLTRFIFPIIKILEKSI